MLTEVFVCARAIVLEYTRSKCSLLIVWQLLFFFNLGRT